MRDFDAFDEEWKVVDFVTVHIYPFWQNAPIGSAIQFLNDDYGQAATRPAGHRLSNSGLSPGSTALLQAAPAAPSQGRTRVFSVIRSPLPALPVERPPQPRQLVELVRAQLYGPLLRTPGWTRAKAQLNPTNEPERNRGCKKSWRERSHLAGLQHLPPARHTSQAARAGGK
jgi:hypothetical protein